MRARALRASGIRSAICSFSPTLNVLKKVHAPMKASHQWTSRLRLNSRSKLVARFASVTPRQHKAASKSASADHREFTAGKRNALGEKTSFVHRSQPGSMISLDKAVETEAVSFCRHRLTRAAGRRLAVELSETTKLALPMMLKQVGQISMMSTDLAFIGRIVTEALAAAESASRVYLIAFTFGVSLLASIAPLAAQEARSANGSELNG